MSTQPMNCPADGCEYESSEHGVKIHYGQEHEGTISGILVECAQCGEETRKDEYRAERSENLFCSTECHDQWRAVNVSGEDAGGWDGGHIVDVECENCGELYEERQDHAEKHDRNFCSQDCYDYYRRHGQYDVAFDGRIGTNIRRRGNWGDVRESIVERDGVCQFCGLSNEANTAVYNKGIEVHHVTPVREFVIDGGEKINWESANQPSNLITLCTKCHRSIEN